MNAGPEQGRHDVVDLFRGPGCSTRPLSGRDAAGAGVDSTVRAVVELQAAKIGARDVGRYTVKDALQPGRTLRGKAPGHGGGAIILAPQASGGGGPPCPLRGRSGPRRVRAPNPHERVGTSSGRAPPQSPAFPAPSRWWPASLPAPRPLGAAPRTDPTRINSSAPPLGGARGHDHPPARAFPVVADLRASQDHTLSYSPFKKQVVVAAGRLGKE